MLMIPKGGYSAILVDPPWSYKMYSDKRYGKSPDQHYDCMDIGQLYALRDEILFAAGPDCALFMWAVWPMLPDALELMAAWGFKYKTGGAWHKKTVHGKTAFGTGYIFRSASEPFILGTIGRPEIKNRSTRNVIEAAVREHSRKPDEQYTLLENLFPGPYLELFSRTDRPGWASWGNETGKFK